MVSLKIQEVVQLMLMFHGSDVLPNFETIHIRANSQGYDAYRPTPETVAIFFHDSPKNHDLYAMMKSALLARARPARSRHLSKIPLAHVVPHRVGVELPGTLERSSWAVEPWNVRGFFRDFPRNGTHFTGGESGVY